MITPTACPPSAATARIGVFDSGLGGLSVLRAIRSLLPAAELMYVADSGHAPYGERGDAQRGSLRHRGIVDARGRLRQQRRCNQQGQGSGEQGAAHRAVPETTKPRV